MDTIENFLSCLSSREKVTYLYGFILLIICNLYIFLTNKRIIKAAPGAEKPSFLWRDSLMKAAQRPFLYSLSFLLLYFIVTVLLKRSPCSEEFRQGGQLLLLALIIWALFSILKGIENDVAYLRMKKLKKVEKTEVDRFFLFAKIVTLFIGLLIALNIFKVNVTSVLTIGGIGGILFSLAARDLFTNLFSGMMLFIERKFEIGDFIKSEKDIMGTVEHITSHSTFVRHLDQSLLIIPNQEFSTIVVQNFSRMTSRWLQIKIPLRYEDLNKIEEILKEMDSIVRAQPQVDTNRSIDIFLEGFRDWALDIIIQAYIFLDRGVTFEQIRHEIYLKILKMIHEKNGAIFQPSTKVYLSSPAEEISNISTKS